MRNALLPLFLVLFAFNANAQDRTLSLMPTIGATATILDTGFGVHAGINPSLPLTERLSAEGQISYAYANVSASFLAGNKGQVHTAHALVGPRLYLSPAEHSTRVYINVLTGLNYTQADADNSAFAGGGYGLGLSGGAFLAFNRITVGLSYETRQHTVLKAGFVF